MKNNKYALDFFDKRELTHDPGDNWERSTITFKQKQAYITSTFS